MTDFEHAKLRRRRYRASRNQFTRSVIDSVYLTSYYIPAFDFSLPVFGNQTRRTVGTLFITEIEELFHS